MFIYYFFDIIIFLGVLLILKNYKIGFIVLFFYYILTPGLLKFVVGNVSIPFQMIGILFLVISYMLNEERKVNLPQRFKWYFLITLFSTLLLIFLSSKIVPINYQLYSFFKYEVFQCLVFAFVGYNALYRFNRFYFFKLLVVCCCLIGLYGIFTYIIHMNPYVNFMSLVYLGQEESAQVFNDSLRGGMSGRIYGTLLHPLGWGQLWNLILPFSFFYKNKINRYLFWSLHVIGVVNCFLSGSRTALICLGITYLFYIIANGWKIMFKRSFLSICLIVILSGFFVPSNSQLEKFVNSTIFFWDDSYIDAANIDGSSSEMRTAQFDVALDIANKNFAGLGYNFQMYELEDSRVYVSGLLGLESVVFKKIVEQGYIGLLIWVVLIFLLFVEIKSNIPIKHRSAKPLLYGFFLTYIASMAATGEQGITNIIFPVLSFMIYQSIKYDTKNNSLLLVRKEKQTNTCTA